MSYSPPKTTAVGDPATSGDQNTYVRDQFNYLCSSIGGLHPTALDHYFGAGAAGGLGDRIHLYGPASGAGYALVEASGTDTNVALALAGKGLGSLIWQGSSGIAQFAVTSGGTIQAPANDHYLGSYALGSGTNVSRLRITSNAGGMILNVEGDGANRDLSFITKGTGGYFFYAASTELATITNTGQSQWVGADHYFGPYALGGSGSRLHMSVSASPGGDTILISESSVSGSFLALQPTGSGFKVVVRDYLGNSIAWFTQQDALAAGFTSLNTSYKTTAGTLTSGQVKAGAPGTGPGGSGQALYLP